MTWQRKKNNPPCKKLGCMQKKFSEKILKTSLQKLQQKMSTIATWRHYYKTLYGRNFCCLVTNALAIHIHPSHILAGKAGAYQSGPPYPCLQILGKVIRRLTETNTLAYVMAELITSVKSFIVLRPNNKTFYSRKCCSFIISPLSLPFNSSLAKNLLRAYH
jgi:hypothetical protein